VPRGPAGALARRQPHLDRDAPLRVDRAALRLDLDQAEVVAVVERVLQREQLAHRERLAFLELDVALDQVLVDHVLLEAERAEVAALAGGQLELDVGLAGDRIDLERVLGVARLEEAGVLGRGQQRALQRLVAVVARDRAHLQRRVGQHRAERHVVAAGTVDRDLERAHPHRVAERHPVARGPAAGVGLERGHDLGPVVAERP